MRILLINGSPKCERSHSYMVAKSFVDGMMQQEDCKLKELTLAKMHLEHCRGCFVCWKVTPGKCAIRDDMDIIMEEILAADVVVLSFPLYCFSVSSLVATVIDRLLPMKEPYNGRAASPENINIMNFRYDLSQKKLVVVSSCAHATTDYVFEPVTRQFELFFGEGRFTTIYSPQGEILLLDQMKAILAKYLEGIKRAGVEFARDGALCEATHKAVNSPLIPPRALEKMMTGYWEGFRHE